jgi:protein-disulfide isomerase
VPWARPPKRSEQRARELKEAAQAAADASDGAFLHALEAYPAEASSKRELAISAWKDLLKVQLTATVTASSVHTHAFT